MGVRRCFDRLYGADLINTFKEGPEYYAHLFADVGVQPEEALVVDDSADAARWASQLGAGIALVSSSPHPEIGTAPLLGSLAELPDFLSQRGRGGLKTRHLSLASLVPNEALADSNVRLQT